MTVLAIDPGIATVGYAVVIDAVLPRAVTYGCIRTSAKSPHPERLALLFKELQQLIKKYRPTLMVVEKLFFAKNVKTALMVGEGRGVAVLAAGVATLPLYEFTPLEVKQAVVGFGRAEKRQVQDMVQRLYSLKTCPTPDDAADALALAYTLLQHMRLARRLKP